MNEEQIASAAKFLRNGELVAFPTETVYGLGADASNPDAIAKLYAAKGRPSNHPVIVHIADVSMLEHWASAVPENAKLLAKKFWPGPLTMILPKADHVRDDITGGQNTVGLRVPAHPLALALLKEFNGGVIAPSANKFGRLSPTRAEDVQSEFGHEIAQVLDGGACTVGIESTIIDLSGENPTILRPGMIEQSELEKVVGPVRTREQDSTEKTLTRVPGDLPSHYAPVTPLRLISNSDIESISVDPNQRVAVLSFSAAPNAGFAWIVADRNPNNFARDLYHNLRRLDKANAREILVERPPRTPDWHGILDRLQRAAN